MKPNSLQEKGMEAEIKKFRQLWGSYNKHTDTEGLDSKIEAFLREALNRVQAEERAKVRIELYQLDWIKILDEAIKNRRTSWGEDVVSEWRNASDEVLGAMMRQAEKKKIFKSPFEKLVEDLRKI